jgi:ATP-dependent exoDNAse (exonuclease V) alpha subunit
MRGPRAGNQYTINAAAMHRDMTERHQRDPQKAEQFERPFGAVLVVQLRRETMQELIDAVRAHAHANYNRDGWDYLVECWDDEYIARTIGNAKTAKTAIAACKRVVKTLDEYRSDIRATAEW